jgi:broad specificity phosphatase PhoE
VGGGESLHAIVERFRPFVGTLTNAVSDAGPILCIGHGGLYRAALPEFLEGVTREFVAAWPFGNTALVEAELRDGRLVCLNWCGRAPS